jgi:hypothetical protein
MPVLQAKARTAESYLAGIGASGALMASAFVLFIVLVGVVTFNAWPHAGLLINGSGGNVSLSEIPTANRAQPNAAPTPNLVALLGGPAPRGTTQASNGSGGAGGTGIGRPGGTTGTVAPAIPPLGAPGGNGPGGNGGNSGGGNPTTTVPPSTPQQPPAAQRTNTLGDVVAGVGNNVESDTNVLGEQLGGSTSPLGGLVQGLGTTLNNTLQQLGGTR